MHQETGNSQSTTHPWPAERDSRQAIQTWPDHSNGMIPSPRGVPSYMLPVAPAPGGPVCHQVQQQTATVCVTGSSPTQAWAVDALSLSWEDLDPYAFPPVAILGKVVEKLQDYPCNRIILIAPGWPNMPWFWDLVTISSQIPLCLPNLGDSAVQPCLAPRTTAIKEQGFSEAVAAQIEAPQRGSTRSVYEAKWTIFTKWCLSNQVDFRAPPLKAIPDFLLHLFQDRKLQPGTIDGYRSAIADKLGNVPINVSKQSHSSP